MMLTLLSLTLLLCCFSPVFMVCLPNLLYDFSAGVTPNYGSGYMQISPPGAVTITSGVANFDGSGSLKLYRFAAMDWQGDHSFTFLFKPTDPNPVTEVSLMSNSASVDTGSVMITYSANQVTLKVMLSRWNPSSLQFDKRTKYLTITGVDLGVMQQAHFTKSNQLVRFEVHIPGATPVPVSFDLLHDEHIEIVGWDPLMFGVGTSVSFSGMLDEIVYFRCYI